MLRSKVVSDNLQGRLQLPRLNKPRRAASSVRCHAACNREQQQAHLLDVGRRGLLAGLAALILGPVGRARAEAVGFEAVRKILRPTDDLTAAQAVVVLMDASSVLREIAGLASTPADSSERFQARKLWPSFAKRLRDVGPAAPLVAGLITGQVDSEETLSEFYGGKAAQPGLTDALYVGLGRVLTISGRTIRPEAQAGPEAALEARAAIDAFLEQVPKDVYNQAQEFRIQRAAANK